MWHLTCITWHVTWHVMWHVTYDIWHVSSDTKGKIILCQNFRSLALMVWVWRCPKDSVQMDHHVDTMQQTAGPVKRVQLQLSGSNLQPTTQSHSKTPGDNKQGTRPRPQGPRRLNGKYSDLKGRRFTPRHQETRSWWQVQFTQGTWRGTLLETSGGGTPTLRLLQCHPLKINY